MYPRPAFLPAPPAKQQPRTARSWRCATPTPSQPPQRPAPAQNKRAVARLHSQAIAAHAKSGNMAALQAAIRQATAAGVSLNAVNYTAIANAHVVHGDPAHAFSILSRMQDIGIPPTNVTLRIAIKAVSAWQSNRAAVQAMRSMLAWVAECGVGEPDVKTWNLALAALVRKHAYDDVHRVLAWMECGAVGGVLHKKTQSRVPKPTACSYNTCMAALGHQGRFTDAIRVFGQMLVRKDLPGGEDATPDVVTYNTLLEIAVGTRQRPFPGDKGGANLRQSCQPAIFVDAIEASMHRQGVRPNITTETLFLRLLTRKYAVPPEPERIWRVHRKVLAEKAPYKPDKRFFDALLLAFANTTDMNGLAVAFAEMVSRGVRIDGLTIRALLVAASCSGDVPLAITILRVSDENGCQMNDHHYTTAIAACARASPTNPEVADSLLTQALDRGMTWTSAMVNATISSYGDDISKAVSLWKQLQACPHIPSRAVLKDRVVYDSLMRVCGRCARPDMALRIIYAAKGASHIMSNSVGSRMVYNAFKRGLEEANAAQKVQGNVIKRQYNRHLKAECGVHDDIDFPVERIRIKL